MASDDKIFSKLNDSLQTKSSISSRQRGNWLGFDTMLHWRMEGRKALLAERGLICFWDNDYLLIFWKDSEGAAVWEVTFRRRDDVCALRVTIRRDFCRHERGRHLFPDTGPFLRRGVSSRTLGKGIEKRRGKELSSQNGTRRISSGGKIPLEVAAVRFSRGRRRIGLRKTERVMGGDTAWGAGGSGRNAPVGRLTDKRREGSGGHTFSSTHNGTWGLGVPCSKRYLAIRLHSEARELEDMFCTEAALPEVGNIRNEEESTSPQKIPSEGAGNQNRSGDGMLENTGTNILGDFNDSGGTDEKRSIRMGRKRVGTFK